MAVVRERDPVREGEGLRTQVWVGVGVPGEGEGVRDGVGESVVRERDGDREAVGVLVERVTLTVGRENVSEGVGVTVGVGLRGGVGLKLCVPVPRTERDGVPEPVGVGVGVITGLLVGVGVKGEVRDGELVKERVEKVKVSLSEGVPERLPETVKEDAVARDGVALRVLVREAVRDGLRSTVGE